MGEEKTFGQKWLSFIKIIFSPGSAIPIFLAAISLFLAIFIFTGSLSNLLAIFASILTSIAGFFIKEDWDNHHGNSLLEKKGRSAIRNLDSIGQQIIQIRGWIKGFISSKNISERELKEIDRHLNTTEMNIKSGLEDWIDIVPELKKKEEVAKKYQETLEAHMEEILKKETELLKVGEENKELRTQLEKKIKELEKRVQDIKNQQFGVMGFGASTPSSFASISPSGSMFSSDLFTKKCTVCGKTYNDNNPSLGTQSITLSNVCPDCKKKSLS